MATRSKRGVRFPHRTPNGHTSGSEGRRSSFSDVSEDGSPTKTKARVLEPVQEVSFQSTRRGHVPSMGMLTLRFSQKPPTAEERQAEYEKKKANFMTRTFWTFVMFGLFFGALFMGHIYIIAIVTAVQIVSFKEVIAIANVPSRARSLSSTKSLNWYWLATTMYFLYGETVIYYFKHIVLVDKVLLPLATHHRFISFILYVFGFVFFVASLQAGHYKFQFTNFAWTHMALYLIVVQAHFIMNNVFEGMIWFFLPAALVITNDIFAYICGIAFGRTQLIKLSPKKTVEGFVGAWIMTVLFSMILVNIMTRSKYFICPVNDLGANIFTGLQCDPNPVFIPSTYSLPQLFFLPPNTNLSVTFTPMQLHSLMFATFASLIAPFGGFFASGLKRTFKIKDFGHSIPGHGGITDRMDCQFIMGFFAYIYYHTFVVVHHVSLGSVLETAITSLTPEEQVELVKGMCRYLGNQGIMPEEVSSPSGPANSIESSF
ncbi:cytidylyltransferase family-domain-containing protein [Stachybotrys elegans]|uniref:Phosphatidate cytidylyltransferase n=1 Tax=Stachybotrys elegans TaxID=80388 RepID=A0A8K0SWF2_9HYPO|nr:cytidylyltransferase family-domain-containing protein [Stachybotrys elegans]